MKGFKIFVCAFAFMALFSITAYAKGSWVRDDVGWWYRRGDGNWPNNAWQWIDGNGDGYAECYYFYDSGYCALNSNIGGYQINADGMWVSDGQVQRKYVGDVIDHINNPGCVDILGTVEVLTYAQMEDRDRVPAEYRSGSSKTIVLFHFDQPKKINIMSADDNNCFIEDVDEVYLPDGYYLTGYNGQKISLSIDFSRAYSPTDLEVPFGRIRVYGSFIR